MSIVRNNCNEFRPNFSKNELESIENTEELRLDENAFINRFILRHLKDYQIEGVRFLYQAYKEQRGAILADEMGLGKTIQVIAFMAAVLNKNGLPSDLNRTLLDCIKKQKKLDESTSGSTVKTFLVCCPASVMANWINELNKWGYFAVSKFHSAQERQDTLRKLERGRCEIVVTSHETARVHMDSLTRFEWSAVVVDEFHKMKNDESLVSRAFHEFTTSTRIGLSGTILQNDLIELWALLDWVNPGCLGPKEVFKLNYCKPILLGQRHNATKSQLARKVEKTEVLKKLKKQWVLRRTKHIISGAMPQKIDKVVYCRLSDFQVDLIKKLRESEVGQFLLNRNEQCKCGNTYLTKDCNCFQHLAKHSRGLVLKLLSVFMKVANHPALFLEGFEAPETDEIDECLKKAVIGSSSLRGANRNAFYEVQNCGKLRVLDSLLEALHHQRAKVLLFSQSVRLLDIIESHLAKRHKGFTYRRLDGRTKTSTRQQIVDEFNRDENIFLFLISTRAGGIGLNMTGANTVIIFDPNWNPTHDHQAQDRAYRLGQERDVHVYRLISSGCIEENIYLRQIYKTHLSKECVEDEHVRRLFCLSANNKSGEFLGIENLFDLDVNTDQQSCKTRQILQRYSAIEKGIAGLEVSNFVPVSPSNRPESPDTDDSKEEDGSEGEDDDLENEFFCADETNLLAGETAADTDGELDTSSEDAIEKILSNKNVVHIHQDKDVCTSSKIETHIRKCAQDEASVPQNAFKCIAQPQLSTLDYVELDKMDFEFAASNSNLKKSKETRFELSDGSFVHYGNVPSEIKKDQFKQMAARLKISPKELAETVIAWTAEERFAGMKRFYLASYPRSIEFYQRFSKFKRKLSVNDDDESDHERTSKKAKSSTKSDEKSQESKKIVRFVDYYQDLNTFENVLGLIEGEDEVVEEKKEKTSSDQPVKNPEDPRKSSIRSLDNQDIDSLFENFMKSTSEIELPTNGDGIRLESNIEQLDEKIMTSFLKRQVEDSPIERDAREEENKKSSLSQNQSKSNTHLQTDQDRYNQILDDLFD